MDFKIAKIETNECTFCRNNISVTGNKVHCKWQQKVVEIPEYCAAKILTSEGWERAATQAKNDGNTESANMLYERAI